MNFLTKAVKSPVDWFSNRLDKVEEKQTYTSNNYKSDLNLDTYNPRYPGFNEYDYNTLVKLADDKGLTGDEKTQFMDSAYQYYYPQVLNKKGLDKRAEEINNMAAENGNAILNGNKQAEYNLKLVDLAQTAKRVKGFAYDYPDEQIIEAMKNEIPDGEQLILNYLNDGDETILYKAGLKKTENQLNTEAYEKRKDNINKALVGNWKDLSEDGLKYLRDYSVMFQVVDEARLQGMGQGMSDSELLANLLYVSPDLQKIAKEIKSLNLDNDDRGILGLAESSTRQNRTDIKTDFRDFVGWNPDTAATLDDIEQAIYERQHGGVSENIKNFKANLGNRGDSVEKFIYRAPKDISIWMDENLPTKGLAELELGKELTDEEYNQYIQDRKSQYIKQIEAFNKSVDKEAQTRREQIGLDPVLQDYYSKQGIVESIFNGDSGAGYKLAGDVAGNWDVILGILGTAVNPAVGLTLMGTDTFVRENQEAYDSLIDAQMKQGVSYEDAYNNARNGAVVVGAINTAIELGLEKVLGGLETRAGNNIKELATKSLNKEVSDMIAKRGIMDMLKAGAKEQAKASLEEGLEEIFQQLVQNIAVSGYDPDHKISDGLWEAFESGALNPMNILAGGSEMFRTGVDGNIDKEQLNELMNSLGISTEGKVNGAYNPKSIIGNINLGDTNGNVNLGTTENTAITPTTQGEITTVDNVETENGPIELIEDETITENTDGTEKKGGSKIWDTVTGLEDNIKEKIKRNPYAIEESKELIKNMEDNPGLDFTEYQNERYESVLDMIEERLKQAEDKRRNDVGGLYTKLEEANAPIDTTNLKNRIAEYQARVEELGDILSSSDKAKIETILKNIEEIGDGTMDIWKVRKIADQRAKYDQGATNDGIRLIREIRNAIDDEIMAQNPDMKEVDQAYRKAKDEIQDLRGNLVYKKTGEIKSNAVSTVKNLLNANNKKYLNTLEKYIPGITDRLQAIRDSKLVYNAYTSGEGSRFVSKGRDFVTKGLLSVAGWSMGGPIGAMVGYLISGKVDKAITNLVRKGLKETMTQQTPESLAELERINKKIEENQNLEAEEKRRLKELGEKIMSNTATMDKTDAEQSAWDNWLSDLEQNEVIDMPEEVYDQWEEVTTTPKKKTTKKKTSKRGLDKNQASSKTADSTADNNKITKDNEGNSLSKEDQEKFGNSKLVDENGNLLVLMHGSPNQEIHDYYDETKAGSNVHADFKGVYFTDNLDLAEQFAHEQLPGSSAFRTVLGKRGHLYKSYVNITNPLNLNTATPEQLLPFFREDVLTKTWDEEKRLDNLKGHPQFVKFHVDMDKVEKAGYDGIIAAIGKEGEGNEYIVFKGNQAKNIGEIKKS